MRIFKNISVRLKGLFSVVLLALLLVGMGSVSLYNLDSVNDASKEISDNYAESISLLGNISSNFESLNQLIYAHILAEDDASMDNFKKKSKTLMTDISNDCKSFEVSLDEGKETETYQNFQSLYNKYLTMFEDAMKHSEENDDDYAIKLVNGDITKTSDQISTYISEMRETNEVGMEEAKAAQTSIYNASQIIIFAIMIIALIAVAVAVLITMAEIANPIYKMQKELNAIVDGIRENNGDLTKRVSATGKDEIGTLGTGINLFIDTIQEIVGQIKESSTSLNDIVETVIEKVSTANDDSNNISAVMEELSAAMEEVASSISNIEADTENVDDNITNLATASEKLLSYTVEMHDRAAEMENTAIENKRSTVDIVNHIIEKLQNAIEESKSVERVNELTNEILNISAQTNLLALNASIEAARAGDAGRGFAVVADEISQLATSSRTAANNIQSINQMVVQAVQELINSSNQIVDYINNNILPDYEGFVASGKQYNDDANHINDTVSSFTGMSNDLQNLISNINTAIKGIATAIDDSANGVSSAAINTNEVVKDMAEIVTQMDFNKEISVTLNGQAEKFTNV